MGARLRLVAYEQLFVLPTGYRGAFEDSARLRQDDLVQVGRKALTNAGIPDWGNSYVDLRSRKVNLLHQ